MKKSVSLRRSIHLINLKAEKALKEAVHEAILDHHRTGDPVVIWRDGKVQWVPASQLLKKKLKRS